MLGKVDLVMWTKNGERTLPLVLRRINEVVPAESVHTRLVVDDQSSDDTVEIAKSMGWAAVSNEGEGISDGANTALKNVETEFFISFEQDLLLAGNWWANIPSYITNSRVAVASGIRFVLCPEVLRKIEEYSMESYEHEERKGTYFPFVKTIDNTIYRTSVIRKLGGFPKIPSSIGVDQALSQRVFLSGCKWKVDYAVRSVHLRDGLRGELAHNRWYGMHLDELEQFMYKRNVGIRSMLARLLLSPARGFDIALKKHAPAAIYTYPAIRLSLIKGLVEGRRSKP